MYVSRTVFSELDVVGAVAVCASGQLDAVVLRGCRHSQRLQINGRKESSAAQSP